MESVLSCGSDSVNPVECLLFFFFLFFSSAKHSNCLYDIHVSLNHTDFISSSFFSSPSLTVLFWFLFCFDSSYMKY